MRKVLNRDEPIGPRGQLGAVLAVEQLVHGGHEFPDVAKDKEPHDGDRDAREAIFSLSQYAFVAVNRIPRSV